MKIPSVPVLVESFVGVLRRFPFVMLAAFCGVIAFSVMIEHEYGSEPPKVWIKLLLTSILGLPFLLSLAIAGEKWQLSKQGSILLSVAGLGLPAVYFYSLHISPLAPGVITMIRFAGLILATHLLVSYIPYLKAGTVEDFWEYNKRLFGNIVVGGVYSGIIFAGLSIAILAVDNLFDVKIDDKIYGHLFAWVAGIFNTSYFLSNFPRQYDDLTLEGSTYTVAIKNLSKFILIPIVSIYFLILYAYSAKILVTWNLPQGWVSSLVLGFSVAGILTYLLNYMLVKFDENVLVREYRKWFFYVLFPMVGLLFVAIGRRLSEYGVTEERFVVATAGVWLFLISLYFIISKKDNIKFIPISLSIFALLAVLGPLSAFRVSHRSQTDRLQSLLEKNAMLVEGKVVAAKDTLASADAESIRSILYYLREHEHFEEAARWFGLPDSIQNPDWSEIDRILGDLKIGYSAPPGIYCEINFGRSESLDVSGFDRMEVLNLYEGQSTPPSHTGWMLSDDRTAIEVFENGMKTHTLNVQPFLKNLFSKYECNPSNPAKEDASFTWEEGGKKMKLVVEIITVEREESTKINSWSGIVLTKLGKENQ
jgi:hypothetical protein